MIDLLLVASDHGLHFVADYIVYLSYILYADYINELRLSRIFIFERFLFLWLYDGFPSLLVNREKAILQQSYRAIHAPAPPRGCVDCIRKELSHPEYHASRPCPPGTKPILERPLVENEAFLNTFDCQEQPRRSSTQRVDCYHEHGCEDQWKPTIRSGQMTSDN